MATHHPVSAPLLSVSDAARSLHLCLGFLMCLLIPAVLLPEEAAAAAKLKITKASWSAKTGMLVVKGSAKNATGPVEIYDINGRLLGRSQDPAFVLKLGRDNLAAVPCAVRVQAGESEATKAVNGSPANCKNVPACQILSPAQATQVSAYTDVTFTAQARLNAPDAGPLKFEWDFAGGSMGEDVTGSSPVKTYKRPDGETATVQFIRDNGVYRVRFSATDALQRRCEDAVDVTVGTPPETPAGVASLVSQAQQSAPKLGSALEGKPGEVVVLPFEDWTQLSFVDMPLRPRTLIPYGRNVSTLNVQVYQKAQLPAAMGPDQVELTYAAGSNPFDPISGDSINTTSQNWPLSGDLSKPTPLLEAAIQKTDIWERKRSTDMMWAALPHLDTGTNQGELIPAPDEGFMLESKPGSRMPGAANPYRVNDPKAVGLYDDDRRGFTARALPVTDIDDSGRVNPFPLFRLTARQKSGSQAASTDAVLSNSRDLQCRGCHEKGGIAADPNAPYTHAAFHSSAVGKAEVEWGAEPVPELDRPEFFAAASNSVFDREYAAALNIGSLHEFYDYQGILSWMQTGCGNEMGCGDEEGAHPCQGCHGSPNEASIGGRWWQPGPKEMDDYNSSDYWAPESIVMHRFHGELQWNPDKTGILRDATGRFVRWDYRQGPNPNTLFPSKDANGNALPMEQNCLRCHAGHREPLYRDRHATAGTTCFDCHGDMLAVGTAWPKAGQDSADPTKRVTWFDQPDCGACHMGDGNLGKDGAGGAFSAGVMKRAFDDANWAAAQRQPYSSRFAITPRSADLKSNFYGQGAAIMEQNAGSPMFRVGKDTHGDVACAACHGAAHATWPNRDPNANDNMTALELQGYAGHIMECKVCHTEDAFKNLDNLDGGRFSGLPADSGILGGPHGIHPVNDRNWWGKAEADTAPISNGSRWGGWHDNVYQKPGLNGEDQCAACHGSDHAGTRLSKTPVDLTFTLRNGKKAKWKAGEFVGCDRCHSLERSFIGGPTGTAKPETNQAPTITSTPVTEAVFGQPYVYNFAVADPDHDAIEYRLNYAPKGMSIQSATGVITWTPGSEALRRTSPPVPVSVSVEASDGKGGLIHQPFQLVVNCPADHTWTRGKNGQATCVENSVGIAITSQPPSVSVSTGDRYQYQVATDATSLPLTYSLIGQPDGMSISAAGLITWQTSDATPLVGTAFQVRVADGQGGHASQLVVVQVCKAPLQWSVDMWMCM